MRLLGNSPSQSLWRKFSVLLVFSFSVYSQDPPSSPTASSGSAKPLVPARPYFMLRPIKEENTIKVGRHLVIETDDGEIHLNVKVTFTINRDNKSIKVHFETQSDEDIVDSIKRNYNWE